MEYHIHRRTFLALSLLFLGVLEFGNAAALYVMYVKHADFGFGVVPEFCLDREANLPTLFNGLLLLFAGLLAMAIARWRKENGGGYSKSWFFLGIILVFLFLDETCQIHDLLQTILVARIHLSGGWSWPWVIPYAVLVLVVAVVFLRFFLALDRRDQFRFALAAGLYVVGAIGFEILGAARFERLGHEDLGYGILFTIEETLEIVACIIASYALMEHIALECPGLEARLKIA